VCAINIFYAINLAAVGARITWAAGLLAVENSGFLLLQVLQVLQVLFPDYCAVSAVGQ
jgi:hypothetical protein